MLRIFGLTLLLGLALPLAAAPDFEIHPFIEAMVVVRSGDQTTETLTRTLGWRQRLNASVDRQQLDAWNLPPQASARQWLLTAPGAERGHLRLFQFHGVEQSSIRPFAQAWETGGLFDVNVMTNDLDRVYRLLAAENWHAPSEPVHIQLPNVDQQQWFPRSPDGLRLSPIERSGDNRHVTGEALVGSAFNATQVVVDLDAALDFYREVLGFELITESRDFQLPPGPNVFGLPYNLLEDMHLSFVMLSADGSRDGTLELISFQEARGRDFSGNVRPPNLGMLGLRFPVSNLRALKATLDKHGVDIIAGPTTVAVQPYGLVEILAVRGPEGMWLEFFE